LWNGAPTSSFWLGGTDHFTVLRACMRNTSSQMAIASDTERSFTVVA
jgi:hypothetical protein